MSKTSEMTAGYLDEYAGYVLEAWELLLNIIAEDRQPNHAERTFFLAKLGWDDRQVREQYRKAAKVKQQQRIAGAPADREATKAEAERTAKVLKTERPKLTAEIEALQKKLRQLETANKQAVTRAADQEEAVTVLRKLVPGHIEDQANGIWRDCCEGPRKELHSKQVRLREIELVGDRANYQNEQAHLGALRSSCWEAVVRADLGDGRGTRLTYSPDWPSIKQAWDSEAKQLRKEIPPLEAEVAKVAAEVQELRDYWSNGKNTV